jgi:hypothetical protein
VLVSLLAARMFSFSIWNILRIIYSIAFCIGFAYLGNYIKAIEFNTSCPLSSGWRISNGKMLSSILMVIGGVNVFCPASKFLSTLPIVGSSYVVLFVLGVFMNLFIINRLAINLEEEEYSQCKIKGYGWITDFFANKGISDCIYYTLGITVVFFYL